MSRSIPPKPSVTLTESERGLRETEDGKLIFTEYRGRRCALLMRGGRLLAASFFTADTEGSIGSVYIGKIKNIARNIDACFVEIGEEQVCFLPLKKAETPFLTNRPYDGRLLEGDELLVQIERDAQKNKQPSVTANISLANDYFALMLGSSRLGFSSRLERETRDKVTRLFTEKGLLRQGCLPQTPEALLTDAEELEALRRADLIPDTASCWETHSQYPPIGAIVRTKIGRESEEIGADTVSTCFFQLTKEMFRLLRTARTRSCHTCLLQAQSPWETALGSLAYPEEYCEIVTDSPELCRELEAYCARHLPDKEVRLYQDKSLSLSKLYSLESRMDTALKPKVWLKSGGYLIIEPTEALTVIDVNSGKNDAGRVPAEAIRKLNLEAAEEIAIQLRLRNLSGIILVDFVNMAEEKSGRELLEHLRELVRHDRMKTTVVDITPLGLVEITRKKGNPPLAEQLEG